MDLLQLEWIKKELKCSRYEFLKFYGYFIINSIHNIADKG
jgi:hypothetical protein